MHEIWASEPRHGRLFILYLVMVSCILIVRSLKLTWRLYSFSSRKRFSLANIRDGIDTPNSSSSRGLPTDFVIPHQQKTKGRSERRRWGRNQCSYPRYTQPKTGSPIWERCSAEVRSTRTLLS